MGLKACVVQVARTLLSCFSTLTLAGNSAKVLTKYCYVGSPAPVVNFWLKKLHTVG